MTESDDPQQRIAELEQSLAAARDQADQWREVAEQRRVAMERIRQHPLVRVLLALRTLVTPLARRIRRPGATALRKVRRQIRALARRAVVARGQVGRRSRRATIARLAAQDRERGPSTERPAVALIVVSRDGGARLAGLVADAARWQRSGDQIIVVDNGDGRVARELAATAAEVIRPERPLSFSAANNLAATRARCDVLLLCNDDVEPLTPHWVDRLTEQLGPDVAAVGAQLVHLPGAHRRHPDFTVQHLGITLRSSGPPYAVNRGGGPPVIGEPVDVPAVTAAVMAVRREALDRIGGFDESYDFGVEDVDLCWRLRQQGWRIRLEPRAVVGHAEGSTRLGDDQDERAARQARNWERFASLHLPALSRALLLDRARGTSQLSGDPLRVAITVTRTLGRAGYGDLATATALRTALTSLGWHVTLVERYRDAWYDLGDADIVLSLLDTFDLRRVARPGLLAIAWVRNWERRWASHPWFDQYDIVLASSSQARALLNRECEPFPLATEIERAGEGDRHGVVLAVNNWGDDRGVPALLAAAPAIELYGRGWEGVRDVAAGWRGQLSPEELRLRYEHAAVVVDVQAPHTRESGSVNARVFDALAAGAVVVTENPAVGDLFGEDVPVFATPADLASLIDRCLADPEPFREAAARARDVVLRDHTYARRAEQLRDVVISSLERTRFALLIGAPDLAAAATWGDLFLAQALADALRAHGHRVDVLARDGWDSEVARTADVVVQLKGRGQAPTSASRLDVLWVISHPEEVSTADLDAVDLVLAGSAPLARHFASLTDTPVRVLRQATDARRFHPQPGPAADVVFVGNSRFAHREVVDAAVDAGLPITVHGTNWERFAPAEVIGSTWVDNDRLAGVYAGAGVVLNDHWPIMRRWSLVSNRVFDVLASGGCLVSDHVAEIPELFGDAVVTYRDAAELAPLVRGLLADPGRRAEMARRGREAVLAAHTFDHRAAELLAAIRELAPEGIR